MLELSISTTLPSLKALGTGGNSVLAGAFSDALADAAAQTGSAAGAPAGTPPSRQIVADGGKALPATTGDGAAADPALAWLTPITTATAANPVDGQEMSAKPVNETPPGKAARQPASAATQFAATTVSPAAKRPSSNAIVLPATLTIGTSRIAIAVAAPVVANPETAQSATATDDPQPVVVSSSLTIAHPAVSDRPLIEPASDDRTEDHSQKRADDPAPVAPPLPISATVIASVAVAGTAVTPPSNDSATPSTTTVRDAERRDKKRAEPSAPAGSIVLVPAIAMPPVVDMPVKKAAADTIVAAPSVSGAPSASLSTTTKAALPSSADSIAQVATPETAGPAIDSDHTTPTRSPEAALPPQAAQPDGAAAVMRATPTQPLAPRQIDASPAAIRAASDAATMAQPALPTAPPVPAPAAAPLLATPSPTASPVTGALPPANAVAAPRADHTDGSTTTPTQPASVPITAAPPAARPVAQPAGMVFGIALAAGVAATRPDQRDDTSPRDQALQALNAIAGTGHLAAVAPAGNAGQGALDMRRDDWPQAMIDHIDALRDAADATSTRIRLVPDALGKVDVSLRHDGDTVHVHFAAEVQATRTMIADAQPRLADLAQARGLRLGQATVDAGTAGQGGQQQAAPPPAQPTRPVSATTIAAEPTDAADSTRLA